MYEVVFYHPASRLKKPTVMQEKYFPFSFSGRVFPTGILSLRYLSYMHRAKGTASSLSRAVYSSRSILDDDETRVMKRSDWRNNACFRRASSRNRLIETRSARACERLLRRETLVPRISESVQMDRDFSEIRETFFAGGSWISRISRDLILLFLSTVFPLPGPTECGDIGVSRLERSGL